MKIKFEILNEQDVRVIDETMGREIGRIFTPAGTNQTVQDAIQVCGFSRAYELWGCGVFADDKGNPLQDIQLLYKDFKGNPNQEVMGNKRFSPKNLPILHKNGCDRCFHWRDSAGNCKCSELRVHKRFADIARWEKRRKRYETKMNVLDKLDDRRNLRELS